MHVARPCCWRWLTAHACAGGGGGKTPSYTEAQLHNAGTQASRAGTDTASGVKQGDAAHDAQQAASHAGQQVSSAAGNAYHGASAAGQQAANAAAAAAQSAATPVVNTAQSAGGAISDTFKNGFGR